MPSPQSPITRQLPQARRSDGWPVWEPPILDYTHLTGEEYEKKRDAHLKYTDHDVVKTTAMLDASIEFGILTEYSNWIAETRKDEDEGVQIFADMLWGEVLIDYSELSREWVGIGVVENKIEDGTWVIMRSGVSSADDEEAKQDGAAGAPSVTTPVEAELPEEPATTVDEQHIILTSTNLDDSTPLPKDEPPSLAPEEPKDPEESAPFALIDLWW